MGTIGQFITLLLAIGVVGAYFWPIALTLAAAWVASRVVLQAIDSESRASVHDDKLRTAVRNSSSVGIPESHRADDFGRERAHASQWFRGLCRDGTRYRADTGTAGTPDHPEFSGVVS